MTTQSVFAGNYTVTAKVTKGTPIITVKPNAATPEEADGAARGRGVRRDHLRRRQGRPDRGLAAAASPPAVPS